MALGFLKKVFSFGKKQVEEVPAEGEAPADARPEEAPAPDASPSPASTPEAPSPVPAPDAAPATEEEPARAQAPEEAQEHFEAPQVPEFLRRAAPEEPPAATPEREPEPEPEPETWDAPEPERSEPAPLPEAPEPEPVAEVPIETPDAPREEPAEPVARALHDEIETEPEPREPAPGDATPEEATQEALQEEPVSDDRPISETPPAAPETVPDGEEDKAVEALPELPIETPDAPHLEATEQDTTGPNATGQDAPEQDATAEAAPAEEPPAAPVAEPDSAAPELPPAPPEPTVEAPVAEAPPPSPSPTPAAGRVSVGKAVERSEAKAPEPAPDEQKKPWFQRLREGLSRSSRELSGSISGIFTKRKLDEDTLQDLEDVLLRADLGLETAMRVTDSLASSRYGKDVSDAEVRGVMATEIEKVLEPVAVPLELDLSHKPHVILVVGVNGTGKTTTIGKLTAKLKEGGLSVMIAAGDTFRAAAIEQLRIWGERTGAPVVASKLGADAAGLAWDAYEKAKQAGSDVLVIDTAGRLQNKAELMAELEKIVRVLAKHDPDAPHTVLQTVDATTGQNALNQVEIFRNVAGVNGLVMTKLDGTARGGILVAIAAKHKLPVYFIGVGEQVDDLEPFSAGDFAKAIAGVE